LNKDYTTIINNNKILINLQQLTKNDEDFIRTMTESSNESLLKICDTIISLINDYKEIAKLGLKMKDLIYSSNKFIDSILDCNPSKVLIENTCFILNCDRASLFTLDKNSDSLIIYQGEGIKKAQIKVPKDKGVVGACFLERKKIRIDDAYLDKRFNQEIDKKTNYRTKSILCYPLLDRNGECFGVIEAINKIISTFNEDDEEFLRILAYQASIIFSNFSTSDDHRFLNKQLNIIIDYNIELYNIKNKFELTEVTEDYLLNVFNCVESVFYFVEDNKIKRYKDNKITNYDINLGIIGRSIKSKDILTFVNIKRCAEFNYIVDLNITDGLLTFPILSKKSKIVRGVAQVPYFGKIFKNGKPNENIVKVIKKFRKCIKYWFENNI
jgi:adenylate cyclase